MVIGILIKFQEHSPLKYSHIRNFSSLLPKAIVHQNEQSCLRFRSLADKLYPLGKITTQVAGNVNNQFDKFIQAASFEHEKLFLKFNFTEYSLDTFLGIYLANESQFKDLWYISKIMFIQSHGQSKVEQGFSVNKEVLQGNLQETSLISQRLVHDTLQSNNTKSQEFIFSKDLRKSCMLLYQKYNLEL